MQGRSDLARAVCITEKVRTPFGPMYVHIDVGPDRQPCGAWISSPGKEPDSTVQQAIEALSAGLDQALRSIREDGK